MQATVTLNLNNSPFEAKLRESQTTAKATARQISTSLNSVKIEVPRAGTVNWGAISQRNLQTRGSFPGLFPQAPRTFRPARPGQYLGPNEASERGFTGVAGLGRAYTVFAGVRQLSAWYERIISEAFKLQATVGKITVLSSGAAFRSEGDIRSNLGSVIETLSKIRERDITESQGGARTPAMTLGHIVKRVRQGLTGGSDQLDEAQKKRLRDQASRDIDSLAEKQRSLNEAEHESTSGSERTAALLKVQIDHRERLGALAEAEAAAGVQNKSARDAENQRAEQEIKGISKRFDLKRREQEMEKSVLNLRNTSLSTDQQSLVAIRKRIELLNAQLVTGGTTEQRTEIATKLQGLKNEELAAQYAESRKPWSQKAAEQNAQLDYRSWVRSQTPSNPNAYISHPDAYNRRDILGNRVDPRGNVMMPSGDNSDKGQGDVVGAIKSLEQKLTDIWTK